MSQAPRLTCPKGREVHALWEWTDEASRVERDVGGELRTAGGV